VSSFSNALKMPTNSSDNSIHENNSCTCKDTSEGADNPLAPKGNMVKALAFRVGLSIVLFICILIAWKLGYIQPSGIPPGA